MLVVVHHGNVERTFQALFYIETLRRLDIFEVDSTEGRSDALNGFTEFLRVLLVDLNVENINAAVNLKQQSLAFHYRLAAHGSNVAQPQYRCSIGDNSY